MKKRFSSRKDRRGVTLLELVISSSLLAVVATSLGLVLRTSRLAWEMNDTEYTAHHHAQTLVLHILRQAREAKRVTQISSGSLSIEDRNSNLVTWTHQSIGSSGRNGTVAVSFGSSGEQHPVAYEIHNLTFIGLEADGTTPTTLPERVRALNISATVNIPGSSLPQQTYSSVVWVRAW